MITVGLTGGAAAGKSAVAAALRSEGAVIADADAITHDLLSGEARDEVLARFGPGILGADGLIDRRALATRVFGDRAERAALETILHPKIRAVIAQQRQELSARNPDAVFVVEAALLVETGGARAYDLLLLVEAPDEEKLRRLSESRGLSASEARRRLDAQDPAGRKLLAADIVIWNDDTREALHTRAREVWAVLQTRGRSRGH